jgi:hypothetical protein
MNYKQKLDLIMSNSGRETKEGLEFYLPRDKECIDIDYTRRDEDYFTISWMSVYVFLKEEVKTLTKEVGPTEWNE